MINIFKKFSKKTLTLIYANRFAILMSLPFFAMDIFTRVFGYKIGYFPTYYPVPNIFSILWIVLFICIVTSIKGITGKIIYWILFALSFAMFLTNTVYYSLTSFYFSFNLLQMAGEGSSYIIDTIVNANPIIYVIAVIILVFTIIIMKKAPKQELFHWKRLTVTFIVFLVLHFFTPFLLGSANSELKWNTFKNPRNIYESYSDSNKSMRVSGLYEYSFRNFYMTFLKPKEKISNEDKEFLNSIYNKTETNEQDDFTGIFQNKNVIFLQLEGMDTWLLSKETTPNLYSLFNHSINFRDHYSIYTGGGSTFNSEFAVNTGFTTPISYTENVYTFNTNTFNDTMAKLFKRKGYTVNAFHMNSAGFYSRGVNYQSWGYDNYFGLIDIADYTNLDYELDRELILNKTFYNNMFPKNKKFVDYIITYSPHTPFTTTKEVGKVIAEKKYGAENIPNLSEEETAKLMVGETDYMVGLLIQALKDNDLYDNTVIVAYADHYLYTILDKTVLDKYKTTNNNLINHTPFFIWSSDVTPTNINKVTMQMNILPTVLNLFGIDYNSNHYIGKNALAKDYKGFAFFSDYSWYDGNVYVENGKVTNKGKISKTELENMNRLVNDTIRKNDLTLKYNYLKD